MSSCPGYTLEAFLAWQYDLVVENQDEANVSLGLAEALGTATYRRPHVTADQFAKLVLMFEPHREEVEQRLDDFDEENQSWRGYAGAAFEIFPKALEDEALAYVRGITAPDYPTLEK